MIESARSASSCASSRSSATGPRLVGIARQRQERRAGPATVLGSEGARRDGGRLALPFASTFWKPRMRDCVVSKSTSTGPLTEAFRAATGGAEPDLVATVLAVSRIPYGRPPEPSPGGVVSAWRGTCSTKHLLLSRLVEESWPEVPLALWHRVYRVTQAATAHWSPEVAATVPAGGLIDVHTFIRAELEERWVTIDVTFPAADWDGRTDMALACGAGDDHRAGSDPLQTKAGLVAAHCEPHLREPFIAALAKHYG